MIWLAGHAPWGFEFKGEEIGQKRCAYAAMLGGRLVVPTRTQLASARFVYWLSGTVSDTEACCTMLRQLAKEIEARVWGRKLLSKLLGTLLDERCAPLLCLRLARFHERRLTLQNLVDSG